jgi:hypothetical protein
VHYTSTATSARRTSTATSARCTSGARRAERPTPERKEKVQQTPRTFIVKYYIDLYFQQ